MSAPYNLQDQVAIITGSANGIGQTIAQKLHESGAYVVISDIEHQKGEATAEALGSRAVYYPCDISNQEQVEELIRYTVQRFGKLDIMVNNAGVNGTGAEDRVTIDSYPNPTWHRIIDIDLNGTFYCCKAASRVMLKQHSGSIINIASIAGIVALRLQLGFVAAKAAVIKMTEAMACELAPFGIRVNTVSPGSIATDVTRKLFYNATVPEASNGDKILSFIPQRRPGETSEVADAVLFLASDRSSYINGHNIVVDGGWISGFNRDF